MKVLVINAGSSSLKYRMFEMPEETVICKGLVERIGESNARLAHETGAGAKREATGPIPDHGAALKKVLAVLTDPEIGAVKDISEISAVGHRVLHSGEDFTDSVAIDDEVVRICKKNTVMGPLHMPANVACIESCREIMPGVPMVATFDTSFHLTMPECAYMYGIPYEDYAWHKLRKYGFHGTSHKFVSVEIGKYLPDARLDRIITCHLGNGSSVAAIKNGKCVDTSMGITPLEGLLMGTRSGDLDPSVVEFMCKFRNIDVYECLSILNHESGFKGISGRSDFRDLTAAAESGDRLSRLAIDMFAHRLKKYIGAYYAILGGLDCVIFTGGIGENSALARRSVMTDSEHLGIAFDDAANERVRGEFAIISKPESKVAVTVLPTNEELVIARDAVRLCGLEAREGKA